MPDLPPYGSVTACPKCRAPEATLGTAYHATRSYWPCTTDSEHLCRHCGRCGYKWSEAVATPVPPPPPLPSGITQPLCPPLDEHGHHPSRARYNMWQIAAWLPTGRESEVMELLAFNGIEVYRT